MATNTEKGPSSAAKLVVTKVNFGCAPEYERTPMGSTSDQRAIARAFEQLSKESQKPSFADGGGFIEYLFVQSDGSELIIESPTRIPIDLEL